MNGPSLVLEKKIIVIILDLTGQSDIVLEQGYTLGLSLPFMIPARESRGSANPVQSLHLLTIGFSLTLPSSLVWTGRHQTSPQRLQVWRLLQRAGVTRTRGYQESASQSNFNPGY